MPKISSNLQYQKWLTCGVKPHWLTYISSITWYSLKVMPLRTKDLSQQMLSVLFLDAYIVNHITHTHIRLEWTRTTQKVHHEKHDKGLTNEPWMMVCCERNAPLAYHMLADGSHIHTQVHTKQSKNQDAYCTWKRWMCI